MSIEHFLKGHLGAEEQRLALAAAGINTLADLLLLPPKRFVRFHQYSDQSSLTIFLKDDTQTDISSLSLESDVEGTEIPQEEHDAEAQSEVQREGEREGGVEGREEQPKQEGTQEKPKVYVSRKSPPNIEMSNAAIMFRGKLQSQLIRLTEHVDVWEIVLLRKDGDTEISLKAQWYGAEPRGWSNWSIGSSVALVGMMISFSDHIPAFELSGLSAGIHVAQNVGPD